MISPARTRTRPVDVLVLDDDPVDAELVLAELERGGLKIRSEVLEEQQAFEDRIDTSPPDIVLADYRLKGWRGVDAHDFIRRRGLDVPVILVTGTLAPEEAVTCMRRGVTDCVFKSELERLPLAVRRALEERRLRGENAHQQALVAKLSLAVDQSPASVFITDPDGKIEYVNERFSEITGYAPSEVLGRNPRILRSGETDPELYERLWKTIKCGEVWHGELRNRRKDGDLYWDSVTISPLRNDRGEITNFVTIQEDITERKWAEKALHERDQRFRQITDNIREVFFVVDARFQQTLYVSPAYEEIWGRTRQSLFERPESFMEGVAERDRRALMASIERIQRGGGPEENEFRVERPDGDSRWVLAHAAPIVDEDAEVYRICGVCTDITERRAAEESLRRSEERARTIVEASFDGMIVTVDGRIVETNPGFEEVLGYAASEVIGQDILGFVAEGSRDEARSRLAGDVEGTTELVCIGKDGKKVIVEATAKSLDVDGRRSRITALRDVTEVRSLEAQFRQAQKMEAVGRLAGGVAHDFNNLLTVITSYADLVRVRLPDDSEVAADVDEIKKAAMGATSLTRQLLAFSRRQVVEPEIVRLADFVSESMKMLGRILGEDIEIEVVAGAVPAVALIDPGQLQQVLLNLTVNARDAMPDGGVLTIESSTTTFDDDYTRTHWPAEPGRYAVLTVSDTGTGMDEETRARVFEPFFTTKESGKGTGLGLASVYGIVKQAGGFVWVYSEPGLGTSFKVYLPEVDDDGLVIETEPLDEMEPVDDATLLLCEDDDAVRTGLRRTLEERGYSVVEVATAEAALDLVRDGDEEVHLLLTDVVMPSMNGVELATAVRKARPGTRVLFMSGYSDDSRAAPAFGDNGTGFIQKPFSGSQLVRKIEALLRRV